VHKFNLEEHNNIKNVHFIGIGGISMSGLSEILYSLGYNISGSDLKESSITEKLTQKGIKVYKGHSAENVKNIDLIVYTAAVKSDNPEYVYAKKNYIPVLERSDLLGQIMKKYNYSINISGTHGKTTTSSIISKIMLEAKKNPTIHLGGELEGVGNTYLGGTEFFITEACEYVNSFLKFHPFIGIILNIEEDHLDYFKDLDDIINSFIKFSKLIPKDGYIILCEDNINCRKLKEYVNCNIITYGIESENAQWKAKDITYNELGFPSYTLVKDNKEITKIDLNIMGLHNVNNSLAAIASCDIFNISLDIIKSAFSKFFGPKRRFEVKGLIKDVKVIDDYAHHPTEIKATLSAVKNGNYDKIWCVFQPHTYTRTIELFDEFSKTFHDADKVIVADIYAAREKDTGIIHSSDLAEKINSESSNSIYMNSFESISNYLYENIEKGDIVITFGAGDIYKVGEMLLDKK
jgi:UDP-N-acetylmuramate--alanine ligase